MSKTVEELNQEAHDRQIEVKRAYSRLFNSKDGKTVLADLERIYHYNSPTVVPGDSHGTHYHEGQRSVVITIKNKMDLTQTRKQEVSHG